MTIVVEVALSLACIMTRFLKQLAIGGRQEASLSLVWTKVRAGMWSGQDAGMMYTIMQSRGPTFYVTRDIKRSPSAMTRSLALAKMMAQQDATEHAKKRKKKSG